MYFRNFQLFARSVHCELDVCEEQETVKEPETVKEYETVDAWLETIRLEFVSKSAVVIDVDDYAK